MFSIIKFILRKREERGIIRKKGDDNFYMKEQIRLLFANWIEDNIFMWKKGDGSAYLVLYIIIPIAVTWLSLSTLPKDDLSKIYCYMTIFISSLNSLYDAANRWQTEKRSVHNTKLFLIILSNVVVSVYCIIVILCILITGGLNVQLDALFLVYFLAVVISMIDIVACFARDMALCSCIKRGGV